VIQNKIFIDRLKNRNIYKDCFAAHNLDSYAYIDAESFFKSAWSIYTKYQYKYHADNNKKINNSINGQVFEIIFGFVLDHENILIDSMDSEVRSVPLVRPDFIVKKNINFFISLKTTIRERWKQADWESLKYKKKFPDAECYLLVNNKQDCESLKKKISLLDIDGVYYAGSKDINTLIAKIK
tara:strand:+ start:353 stop:898 length:546 start_codon:yes stop_codon:yes gene_type:complete